MAVLGMVVLTSALMGDAPEAVIVVAGTCATQRGDPPMTRLYCVWVLAVILAFMLESLTPRLLTLLLPD